MAAYVTSCRKGTLQQVSHAGYGGNGGPCLLQAGRGVALWRGPLGARLLPVLLPA